MKEKSYRANATEINKSPHDVRYVFIMRLLGGRDNVGSTTTYRTLRENIEFNSVEYLKVVDLHYNIINTINLDLLEAFLDEWRENYFDHDWDIPLQFIK